MVFTTTASTAASHPRRSDRTQFFSSTSAVELEPASLVDALPLKKPRAAGAADQVLQEPSPARGRVR
jgi:hypothetical protein